MFVHVQAVADSVRTTLGPRGMDKLVVDSKGATTISNDGATILVRNFTSGLFLHLFLPIVSLFLISEASRHRLPRRRRHVRHREESGRRGRRRNHLWSATIFSLTFTSRFIFFKLII